jgi:hypothetical protein
MTAFSGSFFEGPILESTHCTLTVHACAVLYGVNEWSSLSGVFWRGRGNEEENELSASISFLLAFCCPCPSFALD